MIKMIALDLDATLLTSDKRISDFNTRVLKKLHAAGVRVVICTGRPISVIQNYIDQLGVVGATDYTITFNGALVINNKTRHPLFKSGLTKADFEPIYNFAKRAQLPLNILDFDSIYELTELAPSMYHTIMKADVKFIPKTFQTLPSDQQYSKAIMSTTPDKLDAARDGFNNQGAYHIVRSQPKILEFIAPHMNKAVGLKALLDHYGWTFANLMAFGDAENDLEMIEAAGVGVAMQNGQPEVKRIADQETQFDNDHDGVGQFLANYFKL
ncbi:Cof-type HAD-IIB family hydrolase [Nicoliella spurrieriana]|uniref:Cof-type HAD-IIB family hydrolase n=1 Tax=Nicoliella spurrieriana TaxID=2925830 RepID=A0A976X639_9LACO|nr:Cof-type HAD-IIB family hydrolase [Nicoliella spurrieriana]UQS87152.1 Cof-type HAD-IIB family hydrolase [Nicoliella spurrieriana]